MLKNIRPSHTEHEVYYTMDFMRDRDNGFTFPCDRNGIINYDELPFPAKENLEFCLKYPDAFGYFTGVQKHDQVVRYPAEGDCICGNHVILYDRYYGACPCEKCDRWYNLFGQELLPPDEWEQDPSEEYVEYEPEVF